MDVKVFSAPTTEEGYRQLAERYGPDTMVLRVERDQSASGYLFTVSVQRPNGAPPDAGAPADMAVRVGRVMRQAGFSSTIIGHIAALIADGPAAAQAGKEREALVYGLERAMKFETLEEFTRLNRVILFVGAPGAGKTTTLAKAANGLISQGRKVALVNFDTGRLGGNNQLVNLASIFNLPLIDLERRDGRPLPDERLLHEADVVLCDTPGFHPWRFGELDALLTSADSIGGKAMLVCPAGLDASETGDMLRNARRLSVNHVIVTKCDMSRKLGGIMTAIIRESLTIIGCLRSRQLSEHIVAQNGARILEILVDLLGRGALHASSS